MKSGTHVSRRRAIDHCIYGEERKQIEGVYEPFLGDHHHHHRHHQQQQQHCGWYNALRVPAASWVKKIGGKKLQLFDRQLQMSDTGGTGARNFNFAPKLS